MPLNQAQVGAQFATDGQVVVTRAGRQGDQIASELHGRYYEASMRDTMFSGSIVAQVTTVGLATTYTGLCLSNPIGSGVTLAINKIGYSFIVAFAAGAHIGLMTGFNGTTNVTHTTPVIVRSRRFVGSAAGNSRGLLDSSATLPTAPTVDQIFGSGLTGAITTAPSLGPTVVDLEGSLVLVPGAYAAIYTSTASGAASGAFSIQWEENPL